MKTIAIIIPCYNEEESIPECYKQLMQLSKKIKNYNLQQIYINDGSTDKTLEILNQIKKKDNTIKIISIKPNSGEWVGFKIATRNCDAEYIIDFPSDLQIPTSLIEQFCRTLNQKPKIDSIYAIGSNHSPTPIDGFFSGLYWFWLFFRFGNMAYKKRIDTFLIGNNIIRKINSKNELHNVVPLEIFQTKNFTFEYFARKPRMKSHSKYNFVKKGKMFLKTIIISINPHILNYKTPNYEIIE